MSDDYTYEAWVCPKTDGKMDVSSVVMSGMPVDPINIGAMNLDTNKWSHISVVRDAGKLRTFVNGDPYTNSIIVRSTKRGMYQIVDGTGKVLTYPTKDSLTVALAKHRILNPEIEIIDERKHDE
jgi:hypothetical protein